MASGDSLIPDGTTNQEYKLSEKAIGNGLAFIKTTDVGKSFSSFTGDGSWLNNIKNSDTGTNSPNSVILISYTKANNPMQISTPKPITYVSPKVVNSSSHSVYQGNLISNMVTGGIATSNELVKFESKVLENSEIGNAEYTPETGVGQSIIQNETILYNNGTSTNANSGIVGNYYIRVGDTYTAGSASFDLGNIINYKDLGSSPITTTPSVQTPTLSSSTSKASKSIFGVAVDGSKHYDMIFGQGLIDNSGYNSTKFTNLTNGTTVDDAGHTVNTKVLAVQTQYRR